MPVPPSVKRAVAYFDGQNLFHAAREAFGHVHPNFDPKALAGRICQSRGWSFVQARFYTGVPDRSDNEFWNRFWVKKLLAMSRQGVVVYS